MVYVTYLNKTGAFELPLTRKEEYIMKQVKQNFTLIGGYVSFVDIKESTQKPGEFYGNLSVAYDDGYFDKNNNNQWVERVMFFDVKVTSHFYKQCTDTFSKGDLVEIKGKLIVESWEQDGQNRKAMKVQGEKLVSHVTKSEIECLKAAGLLGSNPEDTDDGYDWKYC